MLGGGHVIISLAPSEPRGSRDAIRSPTLPTLLASLAALVGGIGWVVFFRAGLVLSHYDAKAHLVVARRVLDNLTPGWQQIGAVWLPLPHLIEIVPTQIDFFYRTGIFASMVSIVSLALTCYAAARLILRATGSAIGACIPTLVLALNPNLLYLHTTPMTEPLLLAGSMLSVLWLFEWVEADTDGVPIALGATLFAAVWTRYEAWPIVSVAIAASGFASWRRGARLPTAIGRTIRLALWPAAAIIIFLINSRITVGAWFVSDGFYVPDPSYAHQPLRTLIGIWWGTHEMSGYVVEVVALAGAAFALWRAPRNRADAPLIVPLALFAAAAVSFVAFYQGHPYRIRYVVPLVAACAVFDGLAVGLLARWADLKVGPYNRSLSAAIAALIVASALIESPPWNMQAPMLVEAQWDRGASLGRRDVTACLARDYAGDKILASMGSLAHYMQEL